MAIKINNKNFTGRTVTITNGKVIVDGKDVTPENEKEINIVVDGNIDELNVDACEKVAVNGDVRKLKTMSGDVLISGNVSGNVKTMSGDVRCESVDGDIETLSGDIIKK